MDTVNNRCTGDCVSCGKCKGVAILDEMNSRKSRLFFMPEEFVADKMKNFGISFDIGTTTVVGNLWNLEKGESLQIRAKTNPQNRFGADVISRINYCADDLEKFAEIRKGTFDCLNEIIDELILAAKIKRHEIERITVVGNTTMSHIFAGENPSALATYPFMPAFTGEREFQASSLPLNLSPDAKVILLPNIAGHVGSDITGGVLATRLDKLPGMNLFIDIGTNGEIVLTKGKRAFVCSTAAGPAFEGASIHQGMRAAAGAIESVQIKEGTIFLTTIEHKEPVGICGSGLIEALAEMIKAGIISKTGRLLLPEETTGEPLSVSLASRLREGPSGREFVLVFKQNGEDIVITQMDIREVQLAKAAILAGIRLLLEELEEEAAHIDRMIIAGAFGSYIDRDSGMLIGLFPTIDPAKISFVGNAAGTGASLVLLSEAERREANLLVKRMSHLELSSCGNFQEEYLNAMSF